MVSEMGETWSPYTAPPRVQPKMGSSRCCVWGVPAMAAPMGIRIAIVPQEVPVEKPRKAATISMTAGSRKVGNAELEMAFPTSSPVFR